VPLIESGDNELTSDEEVEALFPGALDSFVKTITQVYRPWYRAQNVLGTVSKKSEIHTWKNYRTGPAKEVIDVYSFFVENDQLVALPVNAPSALDKWVFDPKDGQWYCIEGWNKGELEESFDELDSSDEIAPVEVEALFPGATSKLAKLLKENYGAVAVLLACGERNLNSPSVGGLYEFYLPSSGVLHAVRTEVAIQWDNFVYQNGAWVIDPDTTSYEESINEEELTPNEANSIFPGSVDKLVIFIYQKYGSPVAWLSDVEIKQLEKAVRTLYVTPNSPSEYFQFELGDDELLRVFFSADMSGYKWTGSGWEEIPEEELPHDGPVGESVDPCDPAGEPVTIDEVEAIYPDSIEQFRDAVWNQYPSSKKAHVTTSLSGGAIGKFLDGVISRFSFFINDKGFVRAVPSYNSTHNPWKYDPKNLTWVTIDWDELNNLKESWFDSSEERNLTFDEIKALYPYALDKFVEKLAFLDQLAWRHGMQLSTQSAVIDFETNMSAGDYDSTWKFGISADNKLYAVPRKGIMSWEAHTAFVYDDSWGTHGWSDCDVSNAYKQIEESTENPDSISVREIRAAFPGALEALWKFFQGKVAETKEKLKAIKVSALHDRYHYETMRYGLVYRALRDEAYRTIASYRRSHELPSFATTVDERGLVLTYDDSGSNTHIVLVWNGKEWRES
jgi:hypothetical protein